MTDRITLETRTGTEAARLTDAAKTAKEAWGKSRTKSTRDFVAVCRRVADFTDSRTTKPTKRQSRQFWKALGDPSDFTKSAWRTIGIEANALGKYADHLPSAQEAIKELARAEKKQSGAIDELMKTINENSSVADVRKATAKYLKEPPIDAPTSNQHIANLQATNIKEAVKVLADALTANNSITVSLTDDKNLADQLLDALGKWKEVETNAARVVIDGSVSHHPLAEFERSGKLVQLEKLQTAYVDKLVRAEQEAIRKLVSAHYRKVTREARKALKIPHSARSVISKTVMARRVRENVGWCIDDFDFSPEGTSSGAWIALGGALDDAPEETLVRQVMNVDIGLTETELVAAVKKWTNKLVPSKTFEKLQAEYEKAEGSSPKSDDADPADLARMKKLLARGKQKRDLSHLKTQ